jgi:hypothetical protein
MSAARGLPWYTVLLLSVAIWAVVFGIVATARHFRGPAPEPDPPGEAAEDEEPVLAGVVTPDLAAEFTTAARPYANGVLAVGEDPGGHVSLRDDDHTDDGET